MLICEGLKSCVLTCVWQLMASSNEATQGEAATQGVEKRPLNPFERSRYTNTSLCRYTQPLSRVSSPARRSALTLCKDQNVRKLFRYGN